MSNLPIIDALIANFDALVQEALDAAADKAVELAKGKTKGELAKSIHAVRTGQFTREVTTDKPYAEFVENGRPGFAMKDKVLHFFINGQEIFARSVGPQAAQPFMAPAVKEAQAFLDAKMKSIIAEYTV